MLLASGHNGVSVQKRRYLVLDVESLGRQHSITGGGMGWVWAWGYNTEVAEPTTISLLNQMVSVTLSKLSQKTL